VAGEEGSIVSTSAKFYQNWTGCKSQCVFSKPEHLMGAADSPRTTNRNETMSTPFWGGGTFGGPQGKAHNGRRTKNAMKALQFHTL